MNIHTKNNYCSNHELINLLVGAIEAKDAYTRGHSDRVAEIASWICHEAGMDENISEDIHIAAHLHDIGKIYVPDQILNKKGVLEPDEWVMIKKHPVIGYELLSNISGLKEIALMVLHHHESWDGKGYPDGIKGKSIPIGSRIITIADSIDAMLTERPYRKALSWEMCMQQLNKDKGKKYDSIFLEIAIDVCKLRINSIYSQIA